MAMTHLIPANDLVSHEPFGTSCVCGPAVRFTYLGLTLVHFSLDGREFAEQVPVEEQEPDHGVS